MDSEQNHPIDLEDIFQSNLNRRILETLSVTIFHFVLST